MLRLILLANEAAAQGQQGIALQDGAREFDARDGRVAARRAEAAHLFRLVGAPTCEILSAERRRTSPCRLRSASGAPQQAGRPASRRRSSFYAAPGARWVCCA